MVYIFLIKAVYMLEILFSPKSGEDKTSMKNSAHKGAMLEHRFSLGRQKRIGLERVDQVLVLQLV